MIMLGYNVSNHSSKKILFEEVLTILNGLVKLMKWKHSAQIGGTNHKNNGG